jgi:hypothetical protein
VDYGKYFPVLVGGAIDVPWAVIDVPWAVEVRDVGIVGWLVWVVGGGLDVGKSDNLASVGTPIYLTIGNSFSVVDWQFLTIEIMTRCILEYYWGLCC